MTPTLSDLLERVKSASGPDRQLDCRLMCLVEGWRFIRLSDGNDFAPAYRDVEPGPQHQGRGGRVLKGTMLYFNPQPGPDANHYQQWTSGFTPYTASVDAALALVERLLPGWIVDEMGHDCVGTPGAMKIIGWTVELSDGGRVNLHQGQAPTAPLAILAALLTALQASPAAKENTDDNK